MLRYPCFPKNHTERRQLQKWRRHYLLSINFGRRLWPRWFLWDYRRQDVYTLWESLLDWTTYFRSWNHKLGARNICLGPHNKTYQLFWWFPVQQRRKRVIFTLWGRTAAQLSLQSFEHPKHQRTRNHWSNSRLKIIWLSRETGFRSRMRSLLPSLQKISSYRSVNTFWWKC